MTEARAAVGLDRLPWLNDEAQAQVARPIDTMVQKERHVCVKVFLGHVSSEAQIATGL